MSTSAPVMLQDIPARYAGVTRARPVFLLKRTTGDALFAARWQLPPFHVPGLWAPHHMVAYRVSGLATMTRICDGVEVRRVPAVGTVTFASGDLPTEWAADAAIESIHLYVSSGALRAFAEQHLETAAAPRIRWFFGIRDPWLTGYFQLLASECAQDDGQPDDDPWRVADSLFLDQTEHLLLRHLVRHHSDTPRPASRNLRMRIHPLRRDVTRRVEEYVETHLGDDVSLRVLAGLAQLSVDHFVRAFRDATGKTPHRFVLDQRLGHAAALLKASRVPVAEVARSCGFRSAAHFSVKFQARFGVSPSQYRRTS